MLENRARVRHLFANPLLGRRSTAVLEPAVIVDNFAAVIDINDRLDLSLRRRSGGAGRRSLRVLRARAFRVGPEHRSRHEKRRNKKKRKKKQRPPSTHTHLKSS